MSQHAETTLVRIIKRSVAALRLAVDDLRIEASKVGVQRVCEECDTLSSAVAQIARLIDLTTLDPPKPVNRTRGHELLDQAQRFLTAVEFGFCETCGGVPRQKSQN